jgi:hypothetical protein
MSTGCFAFEVSISIVRFGKRGLVFAREMVDGLSFVVLMLRATRMSGAIAMGSTEKLE